MQLTENSNRLRQLSISKAAQDFIAMIQTVRSANTARTYQNGISAFMSTLQDRGINVEETSALELEEEAVAWFAAALKDMAPTSERLYLTVVSAFFEYLTAENIKQMNLPQVRLLIHQRSRRPGIRLPQFPHAAIEAVLEYADSLRMKESADETEHLRNLRDRAFLMTLADTGLRVHEACNLRRGDLDWFEGRAIIIGKGDKEAVVRFSERAQAALKDYLNARAKLDGVSGRHLSSLPIFARHDKGAGKKVKPITTATGRNIVTERVREKLGEDAVGTITPHSFRHYFVTRVLRGSGNLKLAQELARHKNIAVTQRYAHLSDNELDQGYRDIFETH